MVVIICERCSCLALRHHTTVLKGEAKDLFKGKGRVQLSVYLGGLPERTRLATRHEWAWWMK